MTLRSARAGVLVEARGQGVEPLARAEDLAPERDGVALVQELELAGPEPGALPLDPRQGEPGRPQGHPALGVHLLGGGPLQLGLPGVVRRELGEQQHLEAGLLEVRHQVGLRPPGGDRQDHAVRVEPGEQRLVQVAAGALHPHRRLGHLLADGVVQDEQVAARAEHAGPEAHAAVCGVLQPRRRPRRYSPSLLQPFSGSGRQASRGNTRRWGALSARVPATTMWNCRAMASEEVTASTLRSGWCAQVPGDGEVGDGGRLGDPRRRDQEQAPPRWRGAVGQGLCDAPVPLPVVPRRGQAVGDLGVDRRVRPGPGEDRGQRPAPDVCGDARLGLRRLGASGGGAVGVRRVVATARRSVRGAYARTVYDARTVRRRP